MDACCFDCHGKLRFDEASEEWICTECRLAFEHLEGLPRRYDDERVIDDLGEKVDLPFLVIVDRMEEYVDDWNRMQVRKKTYKEARFGSLYRAMIWCRSQERTT